MYANRLFPQQGRTDLYQRWLDGDEVVCPFCGEMVDMGMDCTDLHYTVFQTLAYVREGKQTS